MRTDTNRQWTTYRILDATIDNPDLADPLNLGESGTGKGIIFWADTADYRVDWDEAGDGNKGSWEFGQDLKGVDVKFFGATTGHYLHWDQSADDLILYGAASRIIVESTVDATAPTDGSIQTDGGVGIALKLFVGTNLDVAGTSALDGNVTLEANLYLPSGGVIDFNTADVTITHAAGLLTIAGGNLRMGTTDRIEFRDDTEYIHSLNDGYIDIVAATGLRVDSAVTIGANQAGHQFHLYGESDGSYLWWQGETGDILDLVNAMVRVTLTDVVSSPQGMVSSIAQGVDYSGWLVGNWGTVNLSSASGPTSKNALGGLFELRYASGCGLTGMGLAAGLYVGAYSDQAGKVPNSCLVIEGIASTGVDFSNMPLMILMDSGAGTRTNILFEVGHEAASKACTSGEGLLFYRDTLQIKVNEGSNHTAYYLPMSTVQGTFTTAYPIVLGDDVELRFGSAVGGDIVVSWTEEELLFTDTRTLGAADYFRTIHATPIIEMYAGSYFGGISCYLTLAGGSGGTWAGAIVGTLEQSEPKSIAGYMAAGIFEAKNSALNCDTASCINLAWKNQAATGFGGYRHSFIRCDDTSPADRRVQCLLELFNMNADVSPSDAVMVCQVGTSTTPSHAIKISIGGVPYWILMEDTAPSA